MKIENRLKEIGIKNIAINNRKIDINEFYKPDPLLISMQ